MYYLTIEKDGKELCVRIPYNDYSEAILACAKYYKPIAKRGVLSFVTEAINGNFARSYAELNRPENIFTDDEIGKKRYAVAAKLTNSFEYDSSFFFLIESKIGIEDADE